MMHRPRFIGAIVLLVTLAPGLGAQSELQFADLGTCELESGEAIENCRLGYRTAGRLNADRSNAILFTTWWTGTSESLLDYVGPNRLIDSSKWFVIAVDAFGNGVSSSPSNSPTQPGDLFPRYTLRDVVSAQRRLLREALGLDHIYAVSGVSLGGMLTFEWVVAYPTFMDKAVPIVGSPQLTSFDLLLWEAVARIIEQCERASCENTGGLVYQLLNVATYTPQERVRRTSRERVAALLEAQEEQARANFHSENVLGQTRAMIVHDVSRHFGDSLERAAAAVRADVLVVIATQDHSVRPEPARAFAALIGAEVFESESDCGHSVFGCETAAVGRAISAFLDRPGR